MSDEQDRLNWIKNLIQIMCCDREIAKPEKKFLFRAAEELGVEVKDWNVLLTRVLRDERVRYPIEDTEMAVAALKSLVVMARADGHVDKTEKQYILRFAKLIGLDNEEFRRTVRDIDIDNLFVPFVKVSGGVVALSDDFDKIGDFVDVAGKNGVEVSVLSLKEFIAGARPKELVCFHVTPDRQASVERCKKLLDISGGRLVSILTRFQGHQVKYMLELGLKKCIIEPVYSKDVHDILSVR